MSEDQLECFPFYCIGEGSNRKEAWEAFKIEAKRHFEWIRGIKYWRRMPEYFTDHNFSQDTVTCQCKARITAVINPLEKAIAINEDNLEEYKPC